MKKILFFTILVLIFSCSKKEPKVVVDSEIIENKNDSSRLSESELNWQTGFNITHNSTIDSIYGNSVRHYIKNKDCSQIAKDFYYGRYRPTDEQKTADLLNLVLTDNNDLRPFYRWILDKTIEISDGALGEYPGIPARKYAEKFPQEFFNFIDSNDNKKTYTNWTEIISYSGFYDEDDYKKPDQIRKNLTDIMIKNSSEKLRERITQFALDSFPDENKTDL